jgi:hypothetical protein
MDMKDRRREERYPSNAEIMFFVAPENAPIGEGQKALARFLDVSSSGFRGSTNYPIEAGHMVKAKLGDAVETFLVRWVKRAGTAYEFGCENARYERRL